MLNCLSDRTGLELLRRAALCFGRQLLLADLARSRVGYAEMLAAARAPNLLSPRAVSNLKHAAAGQIGTDNRDRHIPPNPLKPAPKDGYSTAAHQIGWQAPCHEIKNAENGVRLCGNSQGRLFGQQAVKYPCPGASGPAL